METKNVQLATENGTGNDYLNAILFAFKEFLLEEAGGNMFAEYRLKDKIEKAQKDYRQSRDQLDQIIKPDISHTNVFCRYTIGLK